MPTSPTADEIKSAVLASANDRAKLTDLKNDPDSTRRLTHGLVLGFIQDHDQDKPGFATQQGELTGVGGITSLDGDYFVTRKMILQG